MSMHRQDRERRLQRLRVAGQSQHRGRFYLSRFFADRKYGGKRKANALALAELPKLERAARRVRR